MIQIDKLFLHNLTKTPEKTDLKTYLEKFVNFPKDHSDRRLFRDKLEELKKQGRIKERKKVLEAVKLVLNLYPHKHGIELYAEIIEYLKRS